MPQTVAIRVSDRTIAALRRGESVRIRLDRSSVVGGVTRRPGRKRGNRAYRRTLWFHTDSAAAGGQRARAPPPLGDRARRHRRFAAGAVAHAGLLRREHWGRYSVTAKGRAARAMLSDSGLYRGGTRRRRLAEWAIGHQRPFEVVEVTRLLGISRDSVHTVLTRLLRDRVIERESLGVYRAR